MLRKWHYNLGTLHRGEWLDNDDENSKSIRRIVTVNAYARAWEEIRLKSNFFYRVGVRTGNVFELNDDREVQFSGVNLRGLVDLEGKPKNPFAGKPFRLARKEYLQRQRNRKKRQEELKKRRAESVAEQLQENSKKAEKKRRLRIKDTNKKRKRRSSVKARNANVKAEPIVKTEERSFLSRMPLLDDFKENIPLESESKEPLRESLEVKVERKLTVAEQVFERRRVLAESVFENC